MTPEQRVEWTRAQLAAAPGLTPERARVISALLFGGWVQAPPVPERDAA